MNQSYEHLAISLNTTILTHVKISLVPKFEVSTLKYEGDTGFLVDAFLKHKFSKKHKTLHKDGIFWT